MEGNGQGSTWAILRAYVVSTIWLGTAVGRIDLIALDMLAVNNSKLSKKHAIESALVKFNGTMSTIPSASQKCTWQHRFHTPNGFVAGNVIEPQFSSRMFDDTGGNSY